MKLTEPMLATREVGWDVRPVNRLFLNFAGQHAMKLLLFVASLCMWGNVEWIELHSAFFDVALHNGCTRQEC